MNNIVNKFGLLMILAIAFSVASVSASTVYDFYDTCNTGTGSSSNGVTDTCYPFITYHVHDMGQQITQDGLSLTVEFMNGFTSGCSDHAYVYVSENIDGPWTHIGDTKYTGGGWITVTDAFAERNEDFRYVKIGNYGSCYTDYSSAGVTLPPPAVPEFTVITAGVALSVAIAGFVLVRRK